MYFYYLHTIYTKDLHTKIIYFFQNSTFELETWLNLLFGGKKMSNEKTSGESNPCAVIKGSRGKSILILKTSNFLIYVTVCQMFYII